MSVSVRRSASLWTFLKIPPGLGPWLLLIGQVTVRIRRLGVLNFSVERTQTLAQRCSICLSQWRDACPVLADPLVKNILADRARLWHDFPKFKTSPPVRARWTSNASPRMDWQRQSVDVLGSFHTDDGAGGETHRQVIRLRVQKLPTASPPLSECSLHQFESQSPFRFHSMQTVAMRD